MRDAGKRASSCFFATVIVLAFMAFGPARAFEASGGPEEAKAVLSIQGMT